MIKAVWKQKTGLKNEAFGLKTLFSCDFKVFLIVTNSLVLPYLSFFASNKFIIWANYYFIVANNDSVIWTGNDSVMYIQVHNNKLNRVSFDRVFELYFSDIRQPSQKLTLKSNMKQIVLH